MAELARLDQREPSGSRSECVSPYGVHDMVGNVDEWVVNVSQYGKPHISALKRGGYWGPVRTRCRPMTTEHEETFRYYPIGFRCCDENLRGRYRRLAPRRQLASRYRSPLTGKALSCFGASVRALWSLGRKALCKGGSPYSRRIFAESASISTCS